MFWAGAMPVNRMSMNAKPPSASTPLRILIAPQAFKGSLDAAAVGQAIAAGVRQGWPWPVAPAITIMPLADGGEGTLRALAGSDAGWQIQSHPVAGPLPGQQVAAEWGWRAPHDALIEMATAAGLPLVPPDLRNPGLTTTSGVGELVRLALDHGARRIFIALGGSATNDGGAGFAQALGARFLAADGSELPPGGAALAELDRIDISALDPRLEQTEIFGVTDVTNPLNGLEGASAIYGPQKGATLAQVAELDAALTNYATIIQRDVGRDVALIAGAGAAGGLGAGLLAFGGPQPRLLRGADFVLEAVALRERLAVTDLVMTGEGRLDAQVAYGKLTGTLAQTASTDGVPVICVAGGVGAGYEVAYELGITAIVIAADGPRTLADAMAHAPDLITGAVARAVRWWRMEFPHS